MNKLKAKPLSPNGIQALHRRSPTQSLRLLAYQQLCIVVGHHTGLPNQGLILQLSTGDLLVNALQTDEEHTMAKSEKEKTSYYYSLTYLDIERRWKEDMHFDTVCPATCVVRGLKLEPWVFGFCHPQQVHVTS